MRMLVLLLAGAAIAAAAWVLVGAAAGNHPVTKADIEHAVAQRPRGHVQLVLCNEVFVPSRASRPDPPHTWTCDSYIGPSKADAQNGPSYEVLVADGRIESIHRVPTH